MFFWDFTDKHTIVCTATVLKKNGENFPNVRDHCILLFSVLQTILNQLVKAYRVNKESFVNTFNSLDRDVVLGEDDTIYSVAINRVLMLGLENDAWDVQVFSVAKRFVDPCLEHFGAHLNLFVFALESCAFGLYFGLFGSCFSSGCHLCIMICLSWPRSVCLSICERASSTRLNLTRPHIEVRSGLCNSSGTVLTMHLLSQFLISNRNIQEALEGTLLANRWQLKAIATCHRTICEKNQN